jgi:hypothetical protein
MRRITHRFICGAAIALASCARTPASRPAVQREAPPTIPAPADSVREYSGKWTTGFEESSFQECTSSVSGSIWLTIARGATIPRPPSSVPASPTSLPLHTGATSYYIRAMGILRGPADRRKLGGGYGHLNGSDYQLFVTRVIELAPAADVPGCAR